MKKFTLNIGGNVYTGTEHEPAPISETRPPVLPSPEGSHAPPFEAPGPLRMPWDQPEPENRLPEDACGSVNDIFEGVFNGAQPEEDTPTATPRRVVVVPPAGGPRPRITLNDIDPGFDVDLAPPMRAYEVSKVIPPGKAKRVEAEGDIESFPSALRDMTERAALSARAESWFRFIDLFFPRRVAREEIGEALEIINTEILADPHYPNPRRAVLIKVLSTVAWLLVTTVLHVVSAFRGKKADSSAPPAP